MLFSGTGFGLLGYRNSDSAVLPDLTPPAAPGSAPRILLCGSTQGYKRPVNTPQTGPVPDR